MNIIELSDITFAYEVGEKPVFSNLSLQVKEGTCLIVEGDNGSGKSTLFRILNGLSFPQSGSYSYKGQTISEKYLKDNKKAKAFHREIGYLFQNPDIMLFNARVYDEVAFGPRQMGLSDKKVAQRVEDCLKLFSLEDLKDKAPYHLSGGQKKRVALAAVLALNPEILILDEPCAGLDKKNKEWLISFLSQLKAAGKTLIIATHDSEVKEALGDETLSL